MVAHQKDKTGTDLISRKELSKLIGVSTRTIQRLEKQKMPVIRIGYNTIRYDYPLVKQWLAENKDH